MTVIDFDGRLVDRDRALAELHPPLSAVKRERPDHPHQRARRAAWGALDHRVLERSATQIRSQLADADEFIAEMRRRGVPDKNGNTFTAAPAARNRMRTA